MKTTTTTTVHSKNGRWWLTHNDLEFRGPELTLKHQQIQLHEGKEVTVREVSEEVLQVSDGGRLCVIFYRTARDR